ncbi:MAG: hypothetical protein AAGF11_40520 [Myxococcota bacterium]
MIDGTRWTRWARWTVGLALGGLVGEACIIQEHVVEVGDADPGDTEDPPDDDDGDDDEPTEGEPDRRESDEAPDDSDDDGDGPDCHSDACTTDGDGMGDPSGDEPMDMETGTGPGDSAEMPPQSGRRGRVIEGGY